MDGLTNRLSQPLAGEVIRISHGVASGTPSVWKKIVPPDRAGWDRRCIVARRPGASFTRLDKLKLKLIPQNRRPFRFGVSFSLPCRATVQPWPAGHQRR